MNETPAPINLVASPEDALLHEPRLVAEHGLAMRIARLIEPTLGGIGLRLVRVKLFQQSGTILQIMAERPDGTMTIEDCELANANVSPVLDVDDVVKEAYRLEISSPGIDRPLVRVSDFARAIGDEARIELANPGADGRKRFRGFIRAIEGEGREAVLLLERNDARADEDPNVCIGLRDLEEAKLILTDELVRASLKAGKIAAAEAETDAPAARRGPGRFARLPAKPKPMMPAGTHSQLKKTSTPARPERGPGSTKQE